MYRQLAVPAEFVCLKSQPAFGVYTQRSIFYFCRIMRGTKIKGYLEKAMKFGYRRQAVYYVAENIVRDEWNKNLNFTPTELWLKNLITEITEQPLFLQFKKSIKRYRKTVEQHTTLLMYEIPKWKKNFKPQPTKEDRLALLKENLLKGSKNKAAKDVKVKKTFIIWYNKGMGLKEAERTFPQIKLLNLTSQEEINFEAAKLMTAMVNGKNKPMSDYTCRKWVNEERRKAGEVVKRGGKREGSGYKMSDKRKNEIISYFKNNPNFSLNKISEELKCDKRTIKKVLAGV